MDPKDKEEAGEAGSARLVGEEPDGLPTRIDLPSLILEETMMSDVSTPTIVALGRGRERVLSDPRATGSEVFSPANHTEILRIQVELERSTPAPRGVEPFGRYALMREVARGGDSELRLARHHDEHGMVRWCVIKRLSLEKACETEARALFIDELRVARMLSHPNVVQHYDSGELEGWHVLALELIEGWSVHELTQEAQQPLPLAAVVELGRQLTQALAYVHTLADETGEPLGLVHRDVTPFNVMVNRRGVVKLVDFGISAFRGKTPKTQHGFVRGTERYMAPEQLTGAPLDARTDLFGFGLVLAELIGTPASLDIGLANPRALEHAVRQTCGANPDASEALVDLLARCVAYSRDRRPASAREVQRTLEAIAGDLGVVDALRTHIENAFSNGPWFLSEIASEIDDPSEERAFTDLFNIEDEVTEVNNRPPK